MNATVLESALHILREHAHHITNRRMRWLTAQAIRETRRELRAAKGNA